MDWFLRDNSLRHERVKLMKSSIHFIHWDESLTAFLTSYHKENCESTAITVLITTQGWQNVSNFTFSNFNEIIRNRSRHIENLPALFPRKRMPRAIPLLFPFLWHILHGKCPNTEFFLVLIFSHSDWIRTRKNSVFGHVSRFHWRLPKILNIWCHSFFSK